MPRVRDIERRFLKNAGWAYINGNWEHSMDPSGSKRRLNREDAFYSELKWLSCDGSVVDVVKKLKRVIEN